MSAKLSSNLLGDLQSALSHGTLAKRVDTLRQVTDLFVRFAVEYSDDQIGVFDEVFNCLIVEIETSAKALLATRLAPIEKAPPRIIHALAFDDLIEVAAPVLSQSVRLDDAALILNARSKSQSHLLAISKRRSLSEAVTDVLVECGDHIVLESAVNNPGAAFSESGFTSLLARAQGRDTLTTCLAMRPQIPRHHYLTLIARASDSVRARLEAANPLLKSDIDDAVNEIALRASALMNGEMDEAQNLVTLLHEDGRLDEFEIAAFAAAGKFNETVAAIALLANVPITAAENAMADPNPEGLFVLAKVTGMSWSSLEAILSMQGALDGGESPDPAEARTNYEMLRVSTAQQVVRFYRMRQTADNLPLL